MPRLDANEGDGGQRARWEELFDELIELPEAERGRRLDELGTQDEELAARLRRLLTADADSTGFFERATLGLYATGHDGAADPDAEPQLPAGSVIGPWRVVRLLGRGGMGEVYLAERADGAFVRQAALKIIKPGMDSRAIVRRFTRERQILAGLDHPNLAHLLDGGSGPDGRPYFALEWVDGEPITAYCRRRGLDLAGRLRLMQTVCLAVDAAHRRLVVHRDLKPDNILVTADGTPKLLDFGIAKLLVGEDGGAGAEQTATHLGMRVLTPSYAAPEQILGEPVSTATDVYSLGVLLYELITGSLPHRRNQRTLSALASAVEQETVERPSIAVRRPGAEPRQSREVPHDLDLIVLSALHREPARRYAGAKALADDLDNFLEGRPIQARPNELGYRVRKFVGRHRVTVSAVAVAVAALIGGLAISVRQTEAARAAARRAERVQSFLVSVFRQSDPMLGDGSKVTARELLARGAATIDSGLAGEPDVQADLFDDLARIETSLGLLDQALVHARRALALRQARLPPSDARIGLAWMVLGEVQGAQGGLAEAHRSLAAALAVLVPAQGEDSLDVATARRDLGSVMERPQDRAQSVVLLRQALAVFERRLGETDPETVQTLIDLGRVLEWNERYPAAEAAYRRALALNTRIFGPRHVRTAIAQSLVGSLLDRVGRRREAKPMLEAAIAGERAALGAKHVQLAETLVNYGINRLAEQDYDAADRAFQEALTIDSPSHYAHAQCLRYLGISAMERERYAAAADLFTRATDAFRRSLGENDTQTWRSVANLGSVQAHLGQRSLGRAELAEAVDRIQKISGPESYELCMPLKQFGEVLSGSGEHDAAVATLRRERGIEVKLFGGIEHRGVAATDLLLARALVARGAAGDGRQARQSLDEALGIFARVHPDDTLCGEALLLRGRLALDDGDRALARRHLAAAGALLAARKGAAHADTREAQRLLAAAGGTAT
jgi:tetratricopeptide (TPR) repeat protein